jgi:hypothetical protein
MDKAFKSVGGSYAANLRKYITEPVLKTPASDTRQKATNVGALLADLKKEKR